MTGARIPDEIIDKYTNIAKEICEGYWNKPYDEVQKELEENRENFFEELLNI
jgi:hypothetical protein